VSGRAIFLHPPLIGVHAHYHEGPHRPYSILRIEGGLQVQALKILPIVEI